MILPRKYHEEYHQILDDLLEEEFELPGRRAGKAAWDDLLEDPKKVARLKGVLLESGRVFDSKRRGFKMQDSIFRAIMADGRF